MDECRSIWGLRLANECANRIIGLFLSYHHDENRACLE